jgi:hypothetical protein
VSSVDHWWIFEPEGDRQPPVWMYPGARQALGRNTPRVRYTKSSTRNALICRSDHQGSLGTQPRRPSQ